nr:unnamed protein product [Callosobruchus analis]
MIGVRSGLTKQLNEKISQWLVHIVFALASKTLPQKLRQTLDSAIKIVNHIKSRALNSRISILIAMFFCSIQKYAGSQRQHFASPS